MIQRLKDTIELQRRFPAYALNHAPLWYWYEVISGKKGTAKLPGHSPSDSFTHKEAEKYLNKINAA